MAKPAALLRGSLETAAGDIAHYTGEGYRTVIVCQDERRAGVLADYLEARQIRTSMDFALEALPPNGTCVVTLGALSAGMEYPSAKLAVITEGQFIEPSAIRRKRKALPKNRQRLQSFTDLSPGDLVVHEHHGIGRYVGIFKMPVDGVEKDYIKIAYAGTDSLLYRQRSWTWCRNTSAAVRCSRPAFKNGRHRWTKTKTPGQGGGKGTGKGPY
jgi:transcription-repair coupling factor (superfamily II helicase)